MERSDVTFTSDGVECAAWLYRAAGEEAGSRPVVVMAHGFSATRDQRLDAYAERFAAAGVGALLFDYRHFGASGGEPRQLLDIRRQHADYRAAIAFARTLSWVDPARIALFGSSFSGGHVIAGGGGPEHRRDRLPVPVHRLVRLAAEARAGERRPGDGRRPP